MARTEEFALANIVRVDIITDEASPRTLKLIDVASDADVVAYLSEGQQKVLRVKNTIKAQNNTEDIVLGYDIKLVSATFLPEVLEIVDGGEWDAVNENYVAPVVGVPVERIPFTANIYTEEKDADGSTMSYVKFSYKNCKGKPVNYRMLDGEFFSPEFNLKSRSKLGESPVEIDRVFSLDGDTIEVDYSADGDVTGISHGVTFDSGKFTVPSQIKYFTFMDGTTKKVAVYDSIGKEWSFATLT